MLASVLPYLRRSLPRALFLLVAVLSIASWSPHTDAGEPLPDVVVSRLTLTPSNARVGDTVTATAVIFNSGRVPADASAVHLYFETASGVPSTSVGSTVADPLRAGESREASFAFTVPAVPSRRSYRVSAQVDPGGHLLESNKGNNRRDAWLQVTVPDLALSTLSVRPVPSRAGDPVTAVVVVRNTSQVPAAASTVRLHFAPGDGAPPVALGALRVDPLAPGASHELTLPFTVPPVPPGRSYEVWAQVDPDATLLETNEGNNRRNTWLQVAVADLTINDLLVTPTPAGAGDPLTVSMRVRNQGAVPANPSRLSLYVTTASNTPLGGLTPVTTVDVPALPARTEARLVLAVNPPVLAPASYHLVAMADSGATVTESTETNNRRTTGFEVAVPALTLDSLDVTPSLVSPGEGATASVRIANRGRAWSRPTTAEVFLATSELAEVATGIHVQTIAVSSLRPGASATHVVPVRVPLVNPGAHYVIAQVGAGTTAGASAAVTNAATTGPSPNQRRRSVKLRVALPDLVVNGLSLNPNQGPVGTNVVVTLSVQNSGRAASPPTSVAFYLAASPDDSPATAMALGEIDVPSAEADTSIPLSATLTIPATGAGAYHVLAVVDPVGTVAEALETNNRRSIPLAIDSLEEWATAPYGILITGVDRMTSRSEIASMMERAKAAGASWVRTDFWWYSTEWVGPGIVDWTYFDTLVEEAEARGLQLIPILWGTPRWAATDGVFSYGVPDMAAWERFVFQTASRYRGRVPVWEIWNEPNLPFYWRGTPRRYAELLARAYTQIKRADAQATVLLGGQAQGGGSLPNFLPNILGDPTYPAGEYFDVHNVHTAFSTMAAIANHLDWHRSTLAAHGLTKAIAITELSYTSDPAYQNVPGYTNGEDGQARYLADAYHMLLSQPDILTVVWAALRDYPDGLGEYTKSGLVRVDLSQKPAFATYREMTR